MYIKRLSENSHETGRPKSLEFLRKPQRVSQPKMLYPDESLKRNTDMNRGKVSVEEELREHNNENALNDDGDGPLDGATAPPPLDTSMETSIDPGAGLQSYFPTYHETDMPLVRKKSGEIVRPSLKGGHHQRSKSLPTTPSDRELNRSLYGPPLRPKRSKSVHFDQRDVVTVKYFWKDDSPLDVASQDAQEDRLDLRTNKPSPYDLWLRAENSVQDDDASDSDIMNNRERSPVDLTMALADMRLEKRPHSGLRRSKRYQKHKSHAPGNGKSATAGASDNGAGRGLQADQLGPGLHNENFGILTTTNRMSLKLNIFLNIAHHRQCFLQEITLLGNQQYLVGKVLVKNIFYDKKVVVRYSWNRWRTAHDIESVWVSSGDDVLPGMNMDKFQFVIDVTPSIAHGHTNGHSHGLIHTQSNGQSNHYIQDAYKNGGCVSQHLEFCIQYTSRSERERVEYWDNNGGRNYALDVVSMPRMGFIDPFGDQDSEQE
ncbi:LAFE_0B05270g1_1 [Lachancea fermentati]|uniref:LAFE_0B05270g1_1 n=1 Tax=Lachancea fermentati TaxID=4955 RepID=A0A1G4M896_LACFM|nr:LAFE_0B05270g1_1 [Lachancea fermentati]